MKNTFEYIELLILTSIGVFLFNFDFINKLANLFGKISVVMVFVMFSYIMIHKYIFRDNE